MRINPTLVAVMLTVVLLTGWMQEYSPGGTSGPRLRQLPPLLVLPVQRRQPLLLLRLALGIQHRQLLPPPLLWPLL